jgi:hypothetical protein
MLSRTRRAVENAFGQLVFGVLANTMNLDKESASRVGLSCGVLHNFLKTVYKTYHYDDLGENDSNNLISDNSHVQDNLQSNEGERVRQELIQYFSNLNSSH